MRVSSSLLVLGHWDRVKKGMRKETTRSRVGEETMRWLSSPSLPDDSCRHHFPSLISGLTANPEPFLPSLTDNRCRRTDVSFRNCDLFTPIPGPPLPSFQAGGKKKISQSLPQPSSHSNTGLLPTQLLPLSCHQWLPSFPQESSLASCSFFSPKGFQHLGCDCPVTSRWVLLHFQSGGVSQPPHSFFFLLWWFGG